MTTLLPFTDFLWILQKEEYETGRYLYWLRRFFFRRNFLKSEKLVYTTRAKLTLVLAILLWLVVLGAALILFGGWVAGALAAICVFLLIPAFIALANVLLVPVFAFAHARVEREAAALVKAHTPMTVIAIVGSYGKTTTKHLLYELLRYHHRVQMTPGTVNTTAGIAAWLATGLAPATEVLVLEMDAYHPGEIAASCHIAPPDIVIVTNIGEQHLARFKTHEALRRTLGEAVAHAKKGAHIIADRSTMGQLEEFALGRSVEVVDTTHPTYEQALLAAPTLSQSNRENLARVLTVAEALKIPRAFVEDTVARFSLPERRQQVTELYGYEAIDDSFNISLTTARAGLAAAKELAKERSKKLLVVCAGIPELGPEEQGGNEKLGQAIAHEADHTIVLATMFAPELEKGLDRAPYSYCKRLEDFLEIREQFPTDEWVLLLEPTLPDLYY